MSPPPAEATAKAGGIGFRIGYLPGWEESKTDEERVDRVIAFSPRWVAQWWTLLRARQVVADCYSGMAMSNVWAVHAVELGCLASQWLEEHLRQEGYPADAFRLSSVALTDAHDLANTHKHAGRDGSKRVGRAVSYSASTDGQNTIDLVFAKKGDSCVMERDALELINQCVDGWRTFLLANGLDPSPLPQ